MATEEDWISAGKIAGEALQFGKSIAKPGIKLLDLADQIEDKIYALGAKPAFPTNLSLNQIAAHYVPSINDELILKEEDILKIDVGSEVNGAIGDTALTIGPKTELIKATEEALRAAIKEAYTGNEICKIGRAIKETLQSLGFSPIKNLSGHGLAEYSVHSGLTIPNFDNGNTKVLEEGMHIAIEPFATRGEGVVVEGAPSNIYKLEILKTPRNFTARKVLKFVVENYKTLPFARRWVENKVRGSAITFPLLVRDGILHSYAQLKEKSNALVAQTEHSMIIKDNPIVTTKVD